MKKSMKLVWMVLFALPFFALTSCGDDNDEPAPFKDWSHLLDKTRENVIKEVPFDVDEQELAGIAYDNINSDNVSDLAVLFSFDEYDNKGALITYDKSVVVAEYLYGVSYQTVYNYLEDQYGKASMMTIPGDEYDEAEVFFQFEKGGKYVWLYEDLSVYFIKKSEWDKVYGTKAGENLVKSVRNLGKSLRPRFKIEVQKL